LPDWQKLHPGIALQVIGTQRAVDLERGEADLAIRYMHSPPSGFECHELLRDTFIAVCSPKLLSQQRPMALTELKGRTLLHAWDVPSDANAPTWRRWLDLASVQYEVPKLNQMKHIVFTQELNAIEAAVGGQGILVIGDVLVKREIQDGLLIKAIDFSLPGYGYYVTHIKDHKEPQTIDSFLAWLKQVI
jgi:LysR family glycine cleavage system transcriptional activator